MLKQTLISRTVLMLLLGMSLFSPGAFAQVVRDNGHKGGNYGAQGRSSGQRFGHGNRHYYHNGNWNRNGWFGWWAPAPVYSNGVFVASLPPGYTTVMVGGNTYFYGNDMYFRQMPAGGFAVVTLPFVV